MKWRGIRKTVGVVYRVDEQCGVAGPLSILQMNARIFVAHPHPHPLCQSLPKTSGRVLHHWPSPSHCSRPSPLNKRRDNTVNDEHGCERTGRADDRPLASLLSDIKGAFLLLFFLRCLTNINLIQLNLDHPPMHAPSSLTSPITHSAPILPILCN